VSGYYNFNGAWLEFPDRLLPYVGERIKKVLNQPSLQLGWSGNLLTLMEILNQLENIVDGKTISFDNYSNWALMSHYHHVIELDIPLLIHAYLEEINRRGIEKIKTPSELKEERIYWD
jgi:hypothetical protein